MASTDVCLYQRSSAASIPLNVEAQTRRLVFLNYRQFRRLFRCDAIGQNVAGLYPAMLAVMVALTVALTHWTRMDCDVGAGCHLLFRRRCRCRWWCNFAALIVLLRVMARW